MKNKILSVALALTMLMSMLPVGVTAEKPEASPSMDSEISFSLPEDVELISKTAINNDSDIPDNDELFSEYVNQEFYEGLTLNLYSVTRPARERLSETDKKFYDYLKAKIVDVADNGGSTKFKISLAEFFPDMQTVWTEDDLGTPIVSNNSVTIESLQALFDKYMKNVNLQEIASAMLADFPYDLYWYDKTVGVRTNLDADTIKLDYNIDNGAVKYTLSMDNILLTLHVAKEYQNNGDSYSVMPVGNAVRQAKSNAEAIAKKEYSSDYERLRGFAAEICKATDYNHSAADNADTPYGNPWQLIWAFDNDPNTKVVCEGYAKAFQYLCDLAHKNGYLSNDVSCYIVEGFLAGSGDGVTGAGEHMWNIVTFGGKNYLVDITNCDDGVNMNPTLFLAGSEGPSADAPSGEPKHPEKPDYSFELAGGASAHY